MIWTRHDGLCHFFIWFFLWKGDEYPTECHLYQEKQIFRKPNLWEMNYNFQLPNNFNILSSSSRHMTMTCVYIYNFSSLKSQIYERELFTCEYLLFVVFFHKFIFWCLFLWSVGGKMFLKDRDYVCLWIRKMYKFFFK